VFAEVTKGSCSKVIGRIFSEPANRSLWAAYVSATGDVDDGSTELRPHDRAELACVVTSDHRRASGPTRMSTTRREARHDAVLEILKDGSPFDDPPPIGIKVAGTIFCFTGQFTFGPRKECQSAVVSLGGGFTPAVTRKTQVLVVGTLKNARWSHSSYGNKILEAMVLRLEYSMPTIVSEQFWLELM